MLGLLTRFSFSVFILVFVALSALEYFSGLHLAGPWILFLPLLLAPTIFMYGALLLIRSIRNRRGTLPVLWSALVIANGIFFGLLVYRTWFRTLLP